MNHEEHRTPLGETRVHRNHGSRARHRWLMFACCIPMLAIVIALVVTGVVSVGYAVVALLCVLMMPLMHGGRSHGGGHDEHDRR